MKRELLPFIVAGEEKIIQQEGETRPVRSRGSPNAHYPQNNSHTSHTHTPAATTGQSGGRGLTLD